MSTTTVQVLYINLPPDVDAQLIAALRSGADVDAVELPKGCRGHYQSIVGETFTNDDGVGRQEILARAEVGAFAVFHHEPNNPYDPGAVAVYIRDGEKHSKIGYLPRGHSISLETIAKGEVTARLAGVGKRNGRYGAALYVVRSD